MLSRAETLVKFLIIEKGFTCLSYPQFFGT